MAVNFARIFARDGLRPKALDDRFHETDHGTGNLLWIPRLWLIERGAASWQDGGKRSRWR